MPRTASRPITVHDYRQLSEGPPYFQLIEGDLVMSPSPFRYHQDILLNQALMFRQYLETNSIGKVYIAPSDVYLTELNVYQPDLYFVSNARKSILSEQGTEGAPDLVVEILSPKTAIFDKGVKREVYARTGVRELWLVDPGLKQIQVFQLDQSSDVPVATYHGNQNFQSPLFPGLDVQLEKVFQE